MSPKRRAPATDLKITHPQAVEPLPAPSTSRLPGPRSISSRSSSLASRSRRTSVSSSADSTQALNADRAPPAKRRRGNVKRDVTNRDDDETAVEVVSRPVDNGAVAGTSTSSASQFEGATITAGTAPTHARETVDLIDDPPSPPSKISPTEPLSSFPCPICFSPPVNATLTPCGHICCGECLFTAIKTTMQRAVTHMSPEPPIPR